ncbi:MAG: hypothetical protein ABIS67_15980 [Candidatus Eisenbacteria bacterium]
MTTQSGLWIDHRKAVIVKVSDQGSAATHVESKVERNGTNAAGRGPGGSHGPRESGAEDTRERHVEGQLREFYDDVIAQIRDSEAILIFGPGEAKGELKARLEHDGLGARVVGVETVDKMTDRQVGAKVREHFATQDHGPQAKGTH